jgi:hypothetical protein
MAAVVSNARADAAMRAREFVVKFVMLLLLKSES